MKFGYNKDEREVPRGITNFVEFTFEYNSLKTLDLHLISFKKDGPMKNFPFTKEIILVPTNASVLPVYLDGPSLAIFHSP